MTSAPWNHVKSAIVGNLQLPPPDGQQDSASAPDPLRKVPMLIELNARYPMGLAAVSEAFSAPWHRHLGQAGSSWPNAARYGGPGKTLRVAESKDPNRGYVPRARVGVLSGMAPACELVSIKVTTRPTRRKPWPCQPPAA